MKASFTALGVVVAGLLAWLFLVPSSAGNILIEDAKAERVTSGDVAIVLTINNQGAPDRLLAVASSAGVAALEFPPVSRTLPIPAGRSYLARDAAFVQIADPGSETEEGTLIPLTLTFEKAGNITLKARLAWAKADPHAAMQHGDMAMMSGPMPDIQISAVPDADGDNGGWTVSIATRNFEFSQDRMGQPHMDGVGHGHIYVGAIKLGRVFGPTFRIGALPPGAHEIRVTLNTNDHRPYGGQDAPVSATTRIVVD